MPAGNISSNAYVVNAPPGQYDIGRAPLAPLTSTHTDDILNWRMQPVLADWNPINDGVANVTPYYQGRAA